jgi:hypothetical protein
VLIDVIRGPSRELGALASAMRENKGVSAHIIGLDVTPPADIPAGVRSHAADEWLLTA